MMRFTKHAERGDLHIIGAAGGPTSIPLHQISVLADGILAYETLYSFRNSDGTPMAAAYPGSYGTLVAAGRRP